MPRKIPILQIDAFTSQPFGGNPAGVVLDARGLRDEEMQAIAKEMNLAETAFLTPAEKGGDYRLRWFTPGVEVTFCGHATVATGHAMHEAGMFRATRIVFETLGGSLGLARSGETFWLEPEPRRVTEYREPIDNILHALAIPRGELASWGPPALTPERDLLIPCASLDTLRHSRSTTELGAIGTALGFRGFALVTMETIEPTSKTHSRFYAPHVGVPEDPVTGSMHAALAEYLRSLGLAPTPFIAEQGDLMGRPGRLEIDPVGPRVGGRAVTVLRGELVL